MKSEEFLQQQISDLKAENHWLRLQFESLNRQIMYRDEASSKTHLALNGNINAQIAKVRNLIRYLAKPEKERSDKFANDFEARQTIEALIGGYQK